MLASVVSTLTASALAASNSIIGAGDTQLAPLESEWQAAFHAHTGIAITFYAGGAAAAIGDIRQGLADFAATDAPMSTTQTSTCGSCVQLPVALSAIGIGYHVNGVTGTGGLKLTGPVLAKIYLGQITYWNDSKIAALNKGLHMPHLKIVPVYRNDGSGGTYVFTSYLSQISSAFKGRIGVGTSVSFPVGDGAQGDLGVTGLLNSVNGSIGYAGVSFLAAQRLAAAAIANAAGRYEYPNLGNIQAAAATVRKLGTGNAASIVNPPKSAKSAYPISNLCYAVASKSGAKVALVKQFLEWVLGAGKSYGSNLDFAPLPTTIRTQSAAAASAL